MLSGETAIGKYPIEAVKVMHAIINETENDFSYYEFFKQSTKGFLRRSFLCCSGYINTAYSANAKAIFAFTTSGSTAVFSRAYVLKCDYCDDSSVKVYHQLSLAWV